MVDVVFIFGGLSVGVEDYVFWLLGELGELVIYGIVMCLSSLMGMGWIGDKLVVLFFGNLVFCLCVYDFFVG